MSHRKGRQGLCALAVSGALLAQQLVQVEPAHALAGFDCVMEPARIVRIGSPVSGILGEVVVTRGDTVEPGEVVARLRAEMEQAGMKIHRARAASTARIDAQRSQVELTRKHFERAKVLWEKNIMASSTYDEVEAKYTLARNELERERHEQRLAELEYERSKLALERLTVRSPTRGIVTEQALTAGEFVRPDRHIVTIAELDPLHVEVFLPVMWFPVIDTGIDAVVEPAPPIGGRYEARVSTVDQVFDAASGSFGVRLILPNANIVLPGGHRCRVTFGSEPA